MTVKRQSKLDLPSRSFVRARLPLGCSTFSVFSFLWPQAVGHVCVCVCVCVCARVCVCVCVCALVWCIRHMYVWALTEQSYSGRFNELVIHPSPRYLESDFMFYKRHLLLIVFYHLTVVFVYFFSNNEKLSIVHFNLLFNCTKPLRRETELKLLLSSFLLYRIWPCISHITCTRLIMITNKIALAKMP